MLIGIIADLEVTPIGARFPQGFITVKSVNGTIKDLDFWVDFYASIVSIQNGFLPIVTKKFTIPYQPGDQVTILYDFLKSLNLDETFNPAMQDRLKVNMTAGEFVQIPDPGLPELPVGE